MAKFTAAYIKTLAPRLTPYFVTETDSPGFKLRVLPSGTLSFYFISKSESLKQSIILGRYPEVSIASAREIYRSLRDKSLSTKRDIDSMNLLSNGVDSVETAIRRYEQTALTSLREKTQLDYRGHIKFLRKFFLETNSSTSAINVVFTRANLRPYIKEIALRHPTTAKQRAVVLNRIMDPYLDSGVILEDPLTRLNIKGACKPRQRFLDKEELRLLFAAMVTSQAHPSTLKAIRLQLLTGLRPGEVCRLQRKNIVGASISLLGSETKSKQPLMLPLSSVALSLLQELTEPTGKSQYLLSTDRRFRHQLSLATVEQCLERLCVRSGIPHATPHDLRRTVATHLGALKHNSAVIDAVLNHAPVGVTQRHYNHYDHAEEKALAMGAVEDLMTSLGL